MTPHEILRKAATHLNKSKWIRGDYGTWSPRAQGRHKHCVAGAIYCVMNDQDARAMGALRLLEEAVNMSMVTFWNDHVATSKCQVIAALRKAAGA